MSQMRILLEDDQGEFIVDKPKLAEALKDGKDITLVDIPGRFSVCDVVNGNGRRYSKAVWEQQLGAKSTLMQLIDNHACFGLLEHPKDGVVDLSSPISHVVTKAYMAENGEVRGSIRVLNTPDGKKLAALIESGYNPRVSSRGFGSVNHVNGVDEVAPDYVCEGWDIVARPSCANAVLVVPRQEDKNTLKDRYESLESFKKDDLILDLSRRLGYQTSEQAWEANPILRSDADEQLRESTETTKPVVTVDHQPAQPEHTMTTIEQIKESLRSLSVDPGKMSVSQVTEALRDLESLHNDVAKIAAAEPARGWECQKVHESISNAEKSIHDSLDAPKVTVAKLTEDLDKSYRVIKTLAETANAYKTKLAEEYARSEQYSALVKELTRRGRGWKQRAESLATSGALSERHFVVASEALDELAAMHKAQKRQYVEDVTALGKHVIETDCSESLKDPDLAHELSEAKTPAEVAKLRSKIEAKKKAKNAKPDKTECSGGKTESIKPAKPSESVTESADETDVHAVRPTLKDPSTLEESVAIARRLSGRQ